MSDWSYMKILKISGEAIYICHGSVRCRPLFSILSSRGRHRFAQHLFGADYDRERFFKGPRYLEWHQYVVWSIQLWVHCTALHCTALHCIVAHLTTVHILQWDELHYTTLHFTALHQTVLPFLWLYCALRPNISPPKRFALCHNQLQIYKY